jgi:hypothetical protein
VLGTTTAECFFNWEEDMMDWACSKDGETRNPYRIFVGKSLRKLPLGRLRRRWNCKIQMDCGKVSCEDAMLMELWIWLRVISNSGL